MGVLYNKRYQPDLNLEHYTEHSCCIVGSIFVFKGHQVSDNEDMIQISKADSYLAKKLMWLFKLEYKIRVRNTKCPQIICKLRNWCLAKWVVFHFTHAVSVVIRPLRRKLKSSTSISVQLNSRWMKLPLFSSSSSFM